MQNLVFKFLLKWEVKLSNNKVGWGKQNSINYKIYNVKLTWT